MPSFSNMMIDSELQKLLKESPRSGNIVVMCSYPQRRNQSPAEHLRWSFQAKIVNN